jgi:sulfonate transport system substrate-binding protein
LLDEYYVATLQRAVTEAKAFKLIRRNVSLDNWLEPKYLNNALKELGLQDYWQENDKDGNVKNLVAEAPAGN